ncbi:MAG: glycine zipper 2TM domain-containing protein [Gemmobacter sp.]
MKKLVGAAVLSLTLAAGCTTTTSDRELLGGVGGAALGVLTAQALNANTNWTILAALAGATAGTMVARNTQTRECAYARGDGTFVVRPCP